MKKQPLFRGVATALATPFDEKGIDYHALARMIDIQLTGGTDAIVICGTTGESSTLSDMEKRELIEFTVRQVRHRVPVIAGTGSNNTKCACELSKHAASVGADALLLVTPYYNKCTQKGLVEHYFSIAEAAKLPFIVYSVPARTGMKITPETALELSRHPLAVGFKDAGDSIADTAKTVSLCGDSLPVYSGNDDRVIPVLSLGGLGVISVMSNLVPKLVKRLCTLFFDGKVNKAAELQSALYPLCDALKTEVNPIPLKAALAEKGLCKNILRAPLTSLSSEHLKQLSTVLNSLE